jgi:hypothetical protein
MRATILLLLAITALVAANPGPLGDNNLGDRLLRTFLVFKQIPLTLSSARAAGFSNYDYYGNRNTSCHDLTGIVVTNGGGAPGRTDQHMLVYNINGQLSGFGVRAWGLDSSYPFWWQAPTDRLARDLFLTFRSGLCNTQANSSLVLGDSLTVNSKFSIPLTRAAAIANGFVRGNCIGKMGSHFWYDIKTPGTMTWDATNLLPVLPMYLDDGPNAGHIQAVLIASPRFQWTEPVGMYEGPFTNGIFCKNSCKADQAACSNFKNSGPWATMHWEFNDPAQATCVNAPCQF